MADQRRILTDKSSARLPFSKALGCAWDSAEAGLVAYRD
jgi:hypothetical protein